jgi:hypothetical protein
MNGNAPCSIAEFKRIVKDYTCELVYSYCGPLTEGHKLYGVKRKVIKQQTNALQYEGGSWLEFPPAKETKFIDNGEGSFIMETTPDNGKHLVRQIYRRL